MRKKKKEALLGIKAKRKKKNEDIRKVLWKPSNAMALMSRWESRHMYIETVFLQPRERMNGKI